MSDKRTQAFERFDAPRTVRAIVGVMQVVEEAEDLFSVHSGSGNSYTVDLRDKPVCDCRDFSQRDEVSACKHIRRAYLATGRVAIPAEFDVSAMDEMLVRRIEQGDARRVATDGDGRRVEVGLSGAGGQ